MTGLQCPRKNAEIPWVLAYRGYVYICIMQPRSKMHRICSIYTILPKNPLLFLHIPIPSPLLYLKHPLRQRVRYTPIKSTLTPIAPSSINHHHALSPHQSYTKFNTLNELISFSQHYTFHQT